MRKSHALAAVICYNTCDWTRDTLARFPDSRSYDTVFVDDGSSDGTRELLEASGHHLIRHEGNRGLGAAIRSGIRYALAEGYEVMVVLAGNGKDDPAEIPRLLEGLAGGYDYVQGSRFRSGGSHRNLPRIRRFLIRLHARLVGIVTGFPGTDAVNGFRAYRLELFKDARIDIGQSWLDRYELESYLHYKVLTLGYRVTEVPVSKTYPPPGRGVKYSHIRPVVDWWKILRPLVLLKLGIRN